MNKFHIIARLNAFEATIESLNNKISDIDLYSTEYDELFNDISTLKIERDAIEWTLVAMGYRIQRNTTGAVIDIIAGKNHE